MKKVAERCGLNMDDDEYYAIYNIIKEIKLERRLEERDAIIKEKDDIIKEKDDLIKQLKDLWLKIICAELKYICVFFKSILYCKRNLLNLSFF